MRRVRRGTYCHLHTSQGENHHTFVYFDWLLTSQNRELLDGSNFNLPERPKKPDKALNSNNTNTECVCADPIQDMDSLTFPCMHALHKKCIMQLMNLQCPFCKFSFIQHCDDTQLLQAIALKKIKENKELNEEKDILIHLIRQMQLQMQFQAFMSQSYSESDIAL
uniref:Ring finger domain protein n=1 Tax=Pithovirus LCPAC404 TaxID=2506597 RepID=A0A481ZC03_9VIRU|nr:MAG: ring finger domain protein [Pithovirus LCPAC404]